MECPGQATAPCCAWPTLANGEQRDEVRAAVVAIEVGPPRYLGRCGEGDDGHPTLDQPRDVDVPVPGTSPEIATPQQRIGVEVDDRQRSMQLDGSCRRPVRPRPMDPVQAAFGDLRRRAAEGDAAHNESGRGPEDPGRDRGSAGQAARHRFVISAWWSPRPRCRPAGGGDRRSGRAWPASPRRGRRGRSRHRTTVRCWSRSYRSAGASWSDACRWSGQRHHQAAG